MVFLFYFCIGCFVLSCASFFLSAFEKGRSVTKVSPQDYSRVEIVSFKRLAKWKDTFFAESICADLRHCLPEGTRRFRNPSSC